MQGREVIGAVVFVLVVALLAQWLPTQQIQENQPTGQATQGSFAICINQPPILNYSTCNLTLQQNVYYTCNLSAFDYDGDVDFTFYALNISTPFSFNVTPDGILIAQPDNEYVGNHTFDFIALDQSGCANNIDLDRVSIKVINVNDPPVFVPPLGPFEWELGDTLRSIFLASYFYDPDGDPITYSVTDAPGAFLVSLVQPPELILSTTACGEGYITVTATDSYGASTDSDPVLLSIPCVEEESPGGGGGGGGSSCESNWRCSDWGRCLENGTQKKTCEDLAKCEDEELVFWRECLYVPACQNGVKDLLEEGIDCGGPCPICKTCFDGIQNQGELGVDCGGPCPVCKSCFDGIQNFGETGLDCGGPCPACATCFDGIQNQDETGIDCGGSCPACTELQTPTPIKERNNPYLAWIIGLVATLAVLGLIYRLFHKQIHKAIAKLILFFLRRAKKAILLTIDQRDALLEELAVLERKQLLTNSRKEERARYQDELGVILRKLIVIVLGPVFTLTDAEEALQKLKDSKLVKHLIHKHYIQLESLEQDGVMSDLQLQLHTELLRQRIFGFSEVTKKLTQREVKTKTIKGSSLEQVQSLLYNVSLALQFGNVTAARKNYLQALTIYDSMTAPEQSLLFGLLHLSFDDIKYVASYSKR